VVVKYSALQEADMNMVVWSLLAVLSFIIVVAVAVTAYVVIKRAADRRAAALQRQ
jgi:hypothetical protein